MVEEITEEFLLERASPKAESLEQIKTLNLSRLGLRCKDLPVKLLSRLQALESLDLSGNVLYELPRGLPLPSLHSLDLSDNQMEDMSDNYKLVVLLPKLRMYNGKDISRLADHVRTTSSNILNPRVIAIWDDKFSLPDSLTPLELADLQREFVQAARTIRYGPNSIQDYTQWRVGVLAREHLHSLLQRRKEEEGDESQEPTHAKENNVMQIASPVKRKQAPHQDLRMTPRKRARGDAQPSPAEGQASSAKGHTPPTGLLPLTPQKAASLRGGQQPSSPPAPPAALRVKTPRKRLAEQRQQPREEGGRPKRRAATTGDRFPATPVGDTEGSPRKRSCTGAQLKLPGGAERVHLKPLHVLQCHSKQDSPQDFSTQLWACAFQPNDGDCMAGGRLAATCGGDSLCLIDCETGLVMKKYKVPGEEFFSLGWSTVLMSRENGVARPCSVLAAGGKRGVVKLLHPRANVAYGEFRASRKSLSTLQFSPRQGNLLFTGAYDNKITLWDIGGIDSQYNFKARSAEMEITFPSHLQPSIYLWSWARTRRQPRDKRSGGVAAVLLAELRWATTDVPYLALSTCPEEGYLVLEWPAPLTKASPHPVEPPSINSVAAGPGLSYLVALSDKNMVVVWKRQDSP
ncbi:hypothetical protein CRUP_002139 [Coryphaenoides rupestris]|nr:hypothetical protein CRUP_002139 [Coryphaenoides rupestris]